MSYPSGSTAKRGSNASTASQGSRGASKSRSNISVSSVKSTLSNLSRRSGLSWGRSSQRSSTTRPQDEVWKIGDHGETVSLVTMRQDEALESDCVTELPIGTFCEVVEIGEGRRIKVKSGQFVGWISNRTRLDEPLFERRRNETRSAVEDFEVGGQHEVKSSVTVRAGEALDSVVLQELRPGSIIRIIDIGTTNGRRAKICTENGTEGWISMATKNGELLIGKLSEKKQTSFFGASSQKIKEVLEAARSGDLSAIQRLVEKKESIVSRFQSRVSLNCSDIRGKTPLIYASAFGHVQVVAYLVARPEVDVNSMDDTQKGPLHHAAKKATPKIAKLKLQDDKENSQAEIVGMLIRAKAYIESRDHNGCTALMFAVANGDEGVVMKLLHAHTNVNVKDFEGHTPLDYATNFGHTDLAKILRAYGAKPGEGEIAAGTVVEGVVVDSLVFQGPPGQRGADGTSSMDGSCFSIHPVASATPSENPAPPSKNTVAATSGGPSPKAKAARRSTKTKEEVGDAVQAIDGQEPKSQPSPKRASKKSGAKSKAKGKAKAKQEKHLAAGMQEMLEAKEAAKAEKQEIAVEAEPQEEVVDEKEQARARAAQKLQAVLQANNSAKEMQSAIDAAVQAGVAKEEIDAANQSLKALKERAAARDDLINAQLQKDVALLRAAIAKAVKTGVGEDEIDQAKSVLAIEEPRAQARKKLQAAEEAANTDALKAAILEATMVCLPEDEITYYQDLLAGAESKEKAQEMLREAIESCNIFSLKHAIQQAKDLGVNTSEAEAVLQVEEPKQQARVQLAEAFEQCTIDALREAISTAKRVGLQEFEYDYVAEMLAKEELKEKLLASVNQAIKESKDVDTSNIEALRTEKDKLSNAIKEAKDAGVAESLLADAEMRRRRIHNGIEDLKGSIRVYCRVRPLSSNEESQGDTNCVKAGSDGMSLEVDGSSFGFDAVFLPGTQDELFEECKDLVQSAADGYNVTMFAYGQTGAGKTFTMYGKPGQEGTAPRTIQEIFHVIDAGKERYTYTVMCSMLELYRNDLVDLLAKGTDAKNLPKLNVKTDKQGMVQIDQLTEEECETPEQLMAVLERGNEQRTTASTAMNAESSRSHLVLMIKIVSVNRQTKDQLRGKILLCDLAGSERLKKSKVDAEMQKEAIEINKSLTALGDVIEALTKGTKQIPYRNHKLTQLMQDAIGGSSKTLMFVNCSPASSNSDETLMSLKYATRAKQIKNSAKKVKNSE